MIPARVHPASRHCRLGLVVRALAEPLERRLLLSVADYTDIFSRAVVVNDAAVTLYNHKALDPASVASITTLARTLQAAPVTVTPVTLPSATPIPVTSVSKRSSPPFWSIARAKASATFWKLPRQ